MHILIYDLWGHFFFLLLCIPPTLRNRHSITQPERKKFWGSFHLPEREKAFFQPASGMAQVINAKVLLFPKLGFHSKLFKAFSFPWHDI